MFFKFVECLLRSKEIYRFCRILQTLYQKLQSNFKGSYWHNAITAKEKQQKKKTYSKAMELSDTMCPTYLIFGIKNEHFPGDNFKLCSLILSKTNFKRSTCSSYVLEKTITSSMKIQHMCRCKSDKHSCINHWYVPGEFDNPNGIIYT
jgi:hypothetical protein